MLMLKLKHKNLDFELDVLLTTKNFGDERNSNELDDSNKTRFFCEYKKRHSSQVRI